MVPVWLILRRAVGPLRLAIILRHFGTLKIEEVNRIWEYYMPLPRNRR